MSLGWKVDRSQEVNATKVFLWSVSKGEIPFFNTPWVCLCFSSIFQQVFFYQGWITDAPEMINYFLCSREIIIGGEIIPLNHL